MAIGVRGSAAANSATATTSNTVTIPAEVLAGDVLLLLTANFGATTDPSVADDGGAPNNAWVRVTGQDNTGSGDLWWKRATAGSAGATITVSGATTGCSAVLLAFSGCLSLDLGTRGPYEAESAEANASGNETHAAITTLGPGRWLVFGVANLGNDNAVTVPDATDPNAITTVTIQHLNNPTGATNDEATFLCAAAQGAQGSTGSITWAQTNGITVSVAVALVPNTMEEVLHVADLAPLFPVADLVVPDAAETLHVSDVGGGLIHLIGTLHISETVVDRQLVSPGLSRDLGTPEVLHVAEVATVAMTLVATPTETLHVAETVTPSLTPLFVTPSETLHLADTLTPPVMSADLTVPDAAETLHLAEVATPSLTPLVVPSAAETLHVSETFPTPPVLTADLSVPNAAEALHVSDVGGGLIHVIGSLHVSETVVDRQLVGGTDLTVPDAAETLHVAESATPAMTLVASVAETLHVAEVATPSMDLVASVAETLHVVESVAPSLTPLLASVAEALHISEAAIAVLDEVAVLAETLHVSETAIASLTPLLVIAAETLHVADALTPPVMTADLTRSDLAETLHVAEAVTPSLTPLLVIATETLHVSETAVAAMSLVASGTETLHVADALTPPVLAGPGDLTVPNLTEALHVTDVGGGLIHVIGTLHISETIANINLGNNLSTSRTETLHISDVATVVRDPLEATPVETLHVADAVDSWVTEDQIETVRASETIFDIQMVTVTGDLTRSDLIETLHISESATPAMGLAATPAETLHLVEAATPTLTPLLVSVAETLHVDDVEPPTVILSAPGEVYQTEDLHVVEVATIALTPLIASASETLHISEDETATIELAAVLTETLHVVETLTRALDQIVIASETLHVTEVVQVGAVASLELSETLHLLETAIASLTPLTATLSETLHVDDVEPPDANIAAGLTKTLVETLHIVETVTAFLPELVAALAETLRISETGTVAIDCAVDVSETLHAIDVVQASLDPLFVQLLEVVRITNGAVLIGNPAIIDIIGQYLTTLDVGSGEYITTIDIIGEKA